MVDIPKSTTTKAGAEMLFLPSDSPDLNLIKQLLANLKHLLRRAATRTVDALWDEIGRTLDNQCFTDRECRNYLANPEYRSI